MLCSQAGAWPGRDGWVMEPKWDGFRLLVAVDGEGRIRAWSRRGASLSERLGELLEPLTQAPRGSIFDAELIALGSQDGRAVQDFSAVRRATLQGDPASASRLQLVAFDLLELAGEDLRSRPWTERTAQLREVFPAGGRLRLVQPFAASRDAHARLVELGFEGSVLKRPRSSYRPGRQSAWRKYKTAHRATATLLALRAGRDGNTYAVCELESRRVITLGSSSLRPFIGHELELAYSRIDADGSLRELRISTVAAGR